MNTVTPTQKPDPFSDEAIAAAMNKVMELGHLESAQATLKAIGHPGAGVTKATTARPSPVPRPRIFPPLDDAAHSMEGGAWEEDPFPLPQTAPAVQTAQPAPARATKPEPDEMDDHRNTPKPSAECLYGLVGDIGRAAHEGNAEVNPYAAALATMTALCAGFGRGHYLTVGDEWQHPRLFALHVGRSGRGRKGSASKLLRRILAELPDRHQDVAFQTHTGGLSSREGLVMLIHDGFTRGTGKNAEEVPAVHDKRLWVMESEFSNVLHQSRREGNTISGALRDLWDGQSLKPAVKSQSVGTTHPHVNMLGHITPGELLDLMSSRDMSNGFANRFIMVWAEQTGIDPNPPGTPYPTVKALADRVADVLRHARADRFVERDHTRMDLSLQARTLYERLYRGELRSRSGGERVAGLLERRAPMLLRLALLFALTDKATQIELAHMNAALAWVRYWVDSVKFIFATARDEARSEQTDDAAEKIMAFLTERGEATRTQIANECFKKRAAKGVMDAAIQELLTTAPPRIMVEVRSRGADRPGSATKIYRKTHAEPAESAESVGAQGFAADFDGVRNVRNLRSLGNSTPSDTTASHTTDPHSADSAQSAEGENSPQSQCQSHIPQTPHIPQGNSDFQTPQSDDGEVL